MPIGLIFKQVLAYLPKIWEFVKTHTILVLIIIILLMLGLHLLDRNRIQKLQYQQQINSQNISALMDTVKVEKTKNGELESSRLALAGSVKDLKKLNGGLMAELEKEKGNVKTIIKTEIQFKTDTFVAHNTKVTDSSIAFQYDRVDTAGFRHLAGIAMKKDTRITKDEIGMKLVTGVKERGDKWEIFVRTSYPGVTFSKIDGALIDPGKPIMEKPAKKLGVGFNLSWSPVRCDISGNETSVKLALKSVSIGVGLQYNIMALF